MQPKKDITAAVYTISGVRMSDFCTILRFRCVPTCMLLWNRWNVCKLLFSTIMRCEQNNANIGTPHLFDNKCKSVHNNCQIVSVYIMTSARIWYEFRLGFYGLLMCMWQQCDIISLCLSLLTAWSSQQIFTYTCISILTMHLLYASDGYGHPLPDLLHDVYRPINDQCALRSDARQQRTRRACVRNLW